MRKLGLITIFFATGVVAVLPLLQAATPTIAPWLTAHMVAALNLLGWSVVLAFLFARSDLRRHVVRLAQTLGIDSRFKSIETVLRQLLNEIDRKNSSLSINLVERRMTSKEELSRTLERIVALAYRLLSAESAELALFDRESGLYHSSFVLGKPFRSSAQAMLSGAVEGEAVEISPDVMVQPIAFAGSVLGTLRVGLTKGALPSTGDQDIMRLLALQSSLALINAQYTGELVRMKQSSEETVKAKTGFLANLSHEIRGPLGIILNAVELVLDGLCGPVNEDQLETLKMVRANGAHLLELINDVLDYAKVESGRISHHRVDIVVNDLLRDLSGVVRGQAEAKSHKLVCRPGDEVLAISCDRRHARQMLINLLTNAIKYTPDNGTIEVWAERIPGNKIKINVRDSGVGIEETDRTKVFAAFERIENTYSRNQVGTGLGMPLTKKLAEVNGGTIDFSSRPNHGSHFWLIFPAIDVDTSIAREEAVETPAARGKGELILLIERDEGERTMVARYLEHVGFAVAPASSKIEALEVMRSRKVALTIIDNNIVDHPDNDVIEVVRKSAKSASMPVILVSSRAFVFDIEKYLRAGIDRCLIKPLQLKELGQICRELIDGEYHGSVVDKSELDLTKVSEDDVRRRSGVHARLLNIDDILH